MVKKQLEKALKNIVLDMGYKTTDIVCSIPQNSSFGDYSANIALQLAKQNSENRNQSSLEIAKDLVEKIREVGMVSEVCEKIEIAGPGFINFFIKPEKLAEDLKEVLEKGKEFGKNDLGSGKKARVEFVSANPTGPMHIGNARGGPLGDVLSSVLEHSGYKVVREYIHNDVGGQVRVLGATIFNINHPAVAIEEQKDSAEAYKGTYINELASKVDKIMREEIGIYENLSYDDFVKEAGKRAVDLMLEEIMADCEAMGIKFDHVVYESKLQEKASQVIEELQKKGVVKEKDGALWLAPSDEFLKDRETVVRKSNGEFTYFSSDIVYHKEKFESGADLVIDIFGSNHHGHVPRLQAAVQALGFDPSKLKVILYQYVRVKRGDEIVKMSKRAGNFVIAREVLDEVGRDAFRFFLLNYGPETHMDFDVNMAQEQSNKNPVYYVQYAHARMSSLLGKEEGQLGGVGKVGQLGMKEEMGLIKHLGEFPDLVEAIAKDYQVHHLTTYAISLADLFHKFYETCHVLNAETEELKQARLALVQASKLVLGKTLRLLGVSAPEHM